MLIAEQEQNDIDQSLEHIEQQQRDLLATLEVYEKTTEETMGGQGGSLRSLDTGPADTERDKKWVHDRFLPDFRSCFVRTATCWRLTCIVIWMTYRDPSPR